MKNDLTYSNQGLFTAFYPESPAGEKVWQQIASQTDGTGKIFTIHLKYALKQLGKAGFKIAKTKKTTKKDWALVYSEMAELGL
jgi:hypothetical protein